MIDAHKCATLRGFNVSVADVGDQMHLCHPVLSFEDDPALYLARRLDWIDAPDGLAITDPEETLALGTLLSQDRLLPITSGQGVVAAGEGFVRAAEEVKSGLLDSFEKVTDSPTDPYWMCVATPARYVDLRTRLAEAARTAFDEVFRDAIHRGRRLSRRGDAALFLMRKCASLRRDDFAIRQLAGALQNQNLDVYRRLLMGLAIELDTQEDVIAGRVRSHIDAVRQTRIFPVDIESLRSGQASVGIYQMWMETSKRMVQLATEASRTSDSKVIKSNNLYVLEGKSVPTEHSLQSFHALVCVAYRMREAKVSIKLDTKSAWKTMVNQVAKDAERQGARAWH